MIIPKLRFLRVMNMMHQSTYIKNLDSLSASDHIIVKGARVNNLQNLSVAIPRNQLVVITGLSGSGKSSLAFDTLFAEGHGSFWVGWRSRLWTISGGWRRLLL